VSLGAKRQEANKRLRERAFQAHGEMLGKLLEGQENLTAAVAELASGFATMQGQLTRLLELLDKPSS